MSRTTASEPYSQTKPRIAVVSFPWKSHSPYKFLSELIIILEPISDKIVIIDGNTDRIDTAHSSKIVVRDIGISMHYLRDLKPKYFSAVIWIVEVVPDPVSSELGIGKSACRRGCCNILHRISGISFATCCNEIASKKEHRSRYAR